jgi:hypothetical protein
VGSSAPVSGRVPGSLQGCTENHRPGRAEAWPYGKQEEGLRWDCWSSSEKMVMDMRGILPVSSPRRDFDLALIHGVLNTLITRSDPTAAGLIVRCGYVESLLSNTGLVHFRFGINVNPTWNS